MTGDELKLLRIAYGMTQEEFKGILKVKDVITIKRWESGKIKVPVYVDEIINHLESVIKRAVSELNKFVEELNNKNEEKLHDIALIQYNDADFSYFKSDMLNKGYTNIIHRAIVMRSYLFLKHYCSVFVVTMDRKNYEVYLELTKKTDSESVRAEWACYYKNT